MVRENAERFSIRDAVNYLWSTPFFGKAFGIILFLPFVFLPIVAIFMPPWLPEKSTEGVITWVPEGERIARWVYYEYEVDGKTYEGKLQFVDLKERPDIVVGKKFRVYYHPDWPGISHSEDEPSFMALFLFTIGLWIAMWIAVYFYAKYRTRKMRGPPKAGVRIYWLHYSASCLLALTLLIVGAQMIALRKIPAARPDGMTIQGTPVLVVGVLLIVVGAAVALRNVLILRKKG